MLPKSLKIIFLTFTITCSLFLLKNSPELDLKSYLRNLYTSQDVIDICKDQDVNLGYADRFKNYTAIITNDYFKDNSNAKNLIDFIKDTTNTDALRNYLLARISPYLVVLAFAILAIITWLGYCICCCCPYWCCKPSESPSSCCKLFSTLIIISSYIGVIVCCVLGFIYSSYLIKSASQFNCQILTFYEDIINGQNVTTTPRWAGINGIVGKLDSTVSALDKISDAVNKGFGDTSWTSSEPPKFENSLKTLYSTYAQSTLPNPNPANSLRTNSNNIQPLYITYLGDYTKSGTSLNYVYQEFSTKIKFSATLIDNTKSSSQMINSNIGTVKSTLNNVKDQVGTFKSGIDPLKTNVIDNIVYYQKQINGIGNLASLVLFAVLIGTAAFCLLVIIILTWCGCKLSCLRFILHILWNITYLVMILTFILGALNGILGSALVDFGPLIRYLLSDEFLSNGKIITDKNVANYINICVNNDGNLAERAFNMNGTGTEYINTLYESSAKLLDMKKQLENNKTSIALNNSTETYKIMQNNIKLTTDLTYGNNDISTIFTEFNKWTDSSQSSTYQKSCSNYFKDSWVQSDTLCPTGYSILTSGGSSTSNSCLLLSSWNEASINSRYSTSGCSGNSDFTSTSSAAVAYFNSLNKYSTANTLLLNNLISENSKLNSQFVSLADRFITTLNNIDGVIKPLVEIYNDSLGSNGFFSIVNCKFIGFNISNVIKVIEDSLGPYILSLGAILIAMSFLQFISIFMLVFLLNKYKPTNKDHDVLPKSSV